MARIRGNFAEKWARVTPQRTQDFEEGVRNPRRSWEEATSDSEDRWKTGVQQASQRGSFGKGVKAAGNEKWQRKTEELGTQRFGQGVQAAQDDYQKGFEPFAQVIESTKLPPRFPKGDPRNLDRVKAINEALRRKKTGG